MINKNLNEQELRKLIDERDKIKKEIKEIQNKKKKPEKRQVEIVEYEDGTYSLNGFAYDLPLEKDEVLEAFESWFNGLLEKGIDLNKFNI
jgi:intracellular sulfur oxidation DsrE/DsrF family protein